MTQIKIAIIGECMIELSEKGENLKRGFGGDTLNTAVYLARQVSQQDVRVDYVTALGIDPFSAEMMTRWQAENVNTALIQRLENKMPGLYMIQTDDRGERSFGTGAVMRQPVTGLMARVPTTFANSLNITTIFI